MKRFSLAFLVCLVLAALPACNVKYFEDAAFGDITFDPTLAIPLGEISYTVEELFDELNDAGTTIGTNAEDVVTLTYEEVLQSQSASAFLAVPNQSFSANLASGRTIVNPPVAATVSVSEVFEFDLTQRTNEAYDSISFNGGTFSFDASSDFAADVDFTATFLSLENNGSPLVLTGTLNPGSNTFSQSVSLEGFQGLFHLDDQGNPSSSKFLARLDYDISVTPASVINANDQITFTLNVENTTFNKVYGDVGNQALAVNFQVVNLDFFKDFEAGAITFADPTVKFIFNNSFGFPLSVDFQEVAAISSTGTILALQGDVVNNPQIINAPTVNQQGQIITTEIELNATNSNIDDLISSQPRKVIVEVEAESNPPSIPSVYNFVDDQSIVDILVNIEIPLELTLNALQAEQSIDFSGGSDLKEAKQLLLRIISENELPLGGLVELQFIDDQNNVVHTIDQRAIFDAAPLGAGGRTSEAAVSTTDFLLEDADIRALENAVSINLIATLSTTDAQQGTPVKFFSDYELKFRLAAQVDVELTSNDN